MTKDPFSPADRIAFVRANTAIERPPLVPEIALHVASEVMAMWQSTEDVLKAQGLPPPFWAFAWAGGQALARYILDNPATVAGRRVLDFGAGSGLVAIAASKAGAGPVVAADIDMFACAAMTLNAELNGVAFDILAEDPVGEDADRFDTVLAADVCYERALAERIEPWLRRLAAQGATVLLGDPQRTYLPRKGLRRLARYAVPTTRALEDSDLRNTSVWRVLPSADGARDT